MDESTSIRVPSPTGKNSISVKMNMNDAKNKNPCLEIWRCGCLVRRMTISQHGAIISDPSGFGIPSWSPDETHLVYAAERLAPKTTAFWDKDSQGGIKGAQHVLGQGATEEWGEQYVSQSPLLDLYILNVDTGKVERVKNVPSEYDETLLGGVALGHAVWHPTLPKIAYTGWDAGGLGKMPRRLGMVYCRNRPSSVYSSDVSNLLTRLEEKDDRNDYEAETLVHDEYYECLTSEFPYARSPQYLSSGKMLFLANPNGFISHDGCMGLYVFDDKAYCIVPVVDKPDTTPPLVHGMGFPGLFLSQLPPKVSLNNCNDKYLVLGSTWGSVNRLIRVNVETKQVQLIRLPPTTTNSDKQDLDVSSKSILCQTPDGDLLIARSATNQQPCVWLLPHDDLISKTEEPLLSIVNAKKLADFPSMAASSYSPVKAKLSIPFNVEILSVPVDDDSTPPTQAILCLPTMVAKQKIPLIVIPHGGPHGCSLSNYVPGIAFLARHYALVFPNYRGSTGFGQASLESLLTNVGTNDVQDVMAITDHVVQKYSDTIDTSKVGICGGSHGGFLTAHCTGQFPDYFKAAVMRNPVTNIASMVSATDIPDWCHAEALGAYDFENFCSPTIEQIQALYQKSPIVHVDKVKTPTLMALGMKDLRVPPSQGLEWYHTLRSAGIDTKLLVYPDDNHSLTKVATEPDHWINIKQWFDKYL
jgi:acylaminoacyl-peptidase